jgi:hypothetical protein
MPPKPELTGDQRKQKVSQLLLQVKDGNQPAVEVKWGALIYMANVFDVTSRSIPKICLALGATHKCWKMPIK